MARTRVQAPTKYELVINPKKLIIQLAKDGERDPTRLAERAIGIVRGSS